jgi:hypothetical protein
VSRPRAPFLAILVAGLTPSLFAGPISALYLSAGDQNTIWSVQGTTATLLATDTRSFDYPIAVSGGRLRTYGSTSGHLGYEYTLSGTPTGTSYANTLGSYFYDSTSDGTHNYLVRWSNGEVYRTGTDWSAPSLLFTGPSSSLGITYDPADGTLWLLNYQSGVVSHYTMGGALLGSFGTGLSSTTFLALDPVSNTLWTGTQNNYSILYEFSRTGTALSSEVYANLAGQNHLGGEFELSGAPVVVPEPATLLLSGLGLMLMWRHRRS